MINSIHGQTPENDTVRLESFSDDNDIPVIILSETDLESDELSQDISGLLQSSQDVFVRTAGYVFGRTRFRIRGYDSKYTNVLINGIVVNDAETGRPYWSNWGGLNDAMWNRVIVSGLGYSDYHFGNVGGVTNIITRASKFRPQTRISYASTNSGYRNRIMASHSTGMRPDGWAFNITLSKRWAEQGYIEGTFYDAYAYFFGAEKMINNRHSLGLTFFAAPSRTGRSAPVTAEVHKLTQNNFYNPNWGYQNGVVRNSRVNNYHQPKSILSHYFNIDQKQKLTSSFSYSFGRGGSSALNWYDSPDPRPDYYRYLPSFYGEDEFMHAHLTHLWQNDDQFRQLDWDKFYHANRKNLYTVNNANGIQGNSVTGNRAAYIVEERRNDIRRFDFSSVYVRDHKENVRISAGIIGMMNKTHNFKVIDDLLGADWWLDIDQFAERDYFDDVLIQNDMDNPNRIVKEGDIFGYNYLANINKAAAFAQTEITLRKFDIFAGMELSYTSFWRTGNMRNGRFPETSFGDSPKNNFLDYAVKSGINYKITGRHIIMLNMSYLTMAPNFRDSYISPRTRETTIDNLKSERIAGVDLSYVLRGTNITGRITGYYTDFRDQTYSRSFYHDDFRSFVNYVMSGIDNIHYGIEFGMEAKITSEIVANTVLGYGRYIYNSRPEITIARDNDSEILAEGRTAYLKNYHIGGMPELAASAGLRYNAPQFWFVSANVNYFDMIYIQINPDRRTEEALENFVATDPQINQIIGQKKLEPGMTIDLSAGKSWRISGNFLGFSVNVHNLLNNTDFITNGFEQLRYSTFDIERFPEKYFYMYGRTYFLNIYYRF